MNNYEQLVKALRSASTVSTAWEKLMYDAAAAIEELRFEFDCVNDSIKQLALPVDGEWVRVEDGDSWHYECSRCRERPLYSLYGDIVLSGTCPTCGAKMEVQDGQ